MLFCVFLSHSANILLISSKFEAKWLKQCNAMSVSPWEKGKGNAQQYDVVNIGTLSEMKPSEYEDWPKTWWCSNGFHVFFFCLDFLTGWGFLSGHTFSHELQLHSIRKYLNNNFFACNVDHLSCNIGPHCKISFPEQVAQSALN